jgi:hypothetical protein
MVVSGVPAPRREPFRPAAEYEQWREEHIHACLGQSLARAELVAVFSTLFQRIPTLRLVDGDPVQFQRDPFIFGVKRMPVEW